MHAPHHVDPDLYDQAQQADDWQSLGRINAEILAQSRGDEPPLPAAAPAPAMTREELHAAANEAQAEGDWDTFNRLNVQKLHRQRARLESSVDADQ